MVGYDTIRAMMDWTGLGDGFGWRIGTSSFHACMVFLSGNETWCWTRGKLLYDIGI